MIYNDDDILDTTGSKDKEKNNNTIWIILGLSTLAIASIIIFKKNK